MGKKELSTRSQDSTSSPGLPPLQFSKKNVLGMRLGVIVVEVSFTCMKSISFLQ